MLLTRLSNRVVLALDSDRAGVAAVKRVSGMMLSRSMDVKVAEMPFGKDPADVVRQDPQELKHAIGKAAHVVEFLLKVLKQDTKDDRAYKLTVREELLPLLHSIQNRIDREHFEGVVAESIGTTKDAVHFEVERIEERKETTPALTTPARALPTNPEPQSTSRRNALVNHLFAYSEVLTAPHDRLKDDITQHLKRLLGDEEFTKLKDGERSSDLAKAFFQVEIRIGELHPKELISDLSNMLTTLSHLIARDVLARAREEMERAEEAGDEERIKEAVHRTKDAQNLLGAVIDLTGTSS
jgi:DNA primase